MELKIIVPVHIPEFVPIQKEWFDMMSYDRRYRAVWTELYHKQGEPPSGRNVRQWGTDEFAGKDVYAHWLDCDNLIPPQVIQRLYDFQFEEKILIFSQRWWTNGPKRLNAKPENCVPCKCDIAQLFVHGKFLKDMVWTSRYENDGDFISELYKRYPNDFVFINDVDVWYNSLKPNHGLYNGQIIEIA